MTPLFKKYTNYFLDIVLVLSGFACLASGYVLWFVLPRGMGMHGQIYCGESGRGPTGNNKYFLNFARFSWIEIHNWISVALFAIILLHIILHWNWVVATTKRIFNHIQSRSIKVLELYGAAVTLFTLCVFNLLSGLVLWLVLPRGAEDYDRMVNGAGRTFLGLQRNVWLDLHAWVAVTIVAIITIHLILNWSWVVGVSRKLVRGL